MVELNRRRFFLQLLAAVAGATTASRAAFAQAKPSLVVYKDAGCLCCQAWVEHMMGHGYKATVTNTEMAPIKTKYKIPPTLQSCHTTLVGGYVIEGHVPASDVARLLKEKPKDIVGLTIPGMPASAPGMDQTPFRPYTVLSFDARGGSKPYAVHNRPGLP
jgi:hypothetical protein